MKNKSISAMMVAGILCASVPAHAQTSSVSSVAGAIAGDVLGALVMGQKGCSSSQGSLLTAALRAALNGAISRFEAAIPSPASSQKLGCLESLKSINIDTLSPTIDLSSIGASIANGLASAACSFASSAFSQMTKPLTQSGGVISGASNSTSFP